MHWTAEITVADAAPEAAARWGADVTEALRDLPGLTALDLYTPAAVEDADPLNPPEPPPALVAILSFDTEAALRAACAGPALAEPPPGRATTAAFHRQVYPVPGGDGALSAPVSYLVRYALPCTDVAGFQRIYTAGHPEVQARLPGIRTIHCDIPVPGLGLAGLANAGWLIGNEVAFDSAEAFAAAMRSPARAELRAHMADFPDWSGVNHHHLMHRRRIGP